MARKTTYAFLAPSRKRLRPNRRRPGPRSQRKAPICAKTARKVGRRGRRMSGWALIMVKNICYIIYRQVARISEFDPALRSGLTHKAGVCQGHSTQLLQPSSSFLR